MYVLDTDTLVLVQAGHAGALARRATVPTAEVAVTVVTQIELLRGRFDALTAATDPAAVLRAQERLRRTAELLKNLTVLGFDAAAAETFGRLLKDRNAARKLGALDLMTASIVLANGAALVTRNIRDFQQVPGLRVESWAD